MKCYGIIGLLWAFLFTPLSVFSAQPADDSAVLDNRHSVGLIPLIGRDEADDDSIVYEYGFEDGWSGWTTEDMTDVGLMWHVSEEHAWEGGSSWWCGDEHLGGYDNHWLQYLMTPVLDLSDHEDLSLVFKLYYNCEDPDHDDLDPPDPNDWPDYDGWDGCNVWISTNGGEDWEVLTPVTPDYDFESLFSFGEEWGMGAGIPGWAGFETEWFDAEFDLSDYAEEEVQIRWAFCSDPGWATGDDPDVDREAIGMLVDELQILDGEDVVWENDGTEVGDMERLSMGESAGDHWEISDDDAHSGDFSAHCPIEFALRDALISPPLDIPEEGWYTYFDFWVIANTRMSDSNNDGYLDDYFRIEVSDDEGVTWQDVIYDYGDAGHPDFFEDWGYYGPDVWFRSPDFAEWRGKLNLTQFAGETVYLRWVCLTDSVTEGDQGTGIWIDDFRLLTTSRRETDVGIEWMYIAYPVTTSAVTPCHILVKNHGLATQDFVQKFFRIDDAERGTPITPWQEDLPPDSSETYNFRLRELPYAGMATVTAWLQVQDDEDPSNDHVSADLVIYPDNMAKLGYDMRQWDTRITFAVDNGPAVLFTPSDDDFADAFDLNAIEVRWSNAEQDEDVTTTLRVFDEINNTLGRELYSREITVTPDDLYPNVQRIDLSDVEALKKLDEDFFVYFNINHYNEENDNYWPQPLGRSIGGNDPHWGDGHYFVANGQNAESRDELEYQIQAIVSEAETIADGIDLVASRDEIDFGEVWRAKTVRLTAFGGGAEPVTIDGVSVDNDAFTVTADSEFPIVLTTCSHAVFNVTFEVDEEDDYSGLLTFDCDDETPPEVQLNAVYNVESRETTPPAGFALGEAYPNPFNATAVIPFSLRQQTDVSLAVYDLIGRKVADLVQGSLPAGRHEVTLDAERLAAGVYLCRLEAGSFSSVRKVVLIK